ncbi:hypothetical protein BMS3Bbin06_00721 [bacterium BMS3Bbin06]|nr:hypothetical protein BMS3Bbin06_00721 [bacterium BMS3Bbin06]
MNLEIKPLPPFERNLKLLKKKYPNIWKDPEKLKTTLMADPSPPSQSIISRIEGFTHGLPELSMLKKIADALDATLVIKFRPKKS